MTNVIVTHEQNPKVKELLGYQWACTAAVLFYNMQGQPGFKGCKCLCGSLQAVWSCLSTETVRVMSVSVCFVSIEFEFPGGQPCYNHVNCLRAGHLQSLQPKHGSGLDEFCCLQSSSDYIDDNTAIV